MNVKSEENLTPLHIAAKKGREELTVKLVKRSARINAKTKLGMTPLHYTARYDHERIVKILVQHKAKLLENNKGETAIHYATKRDIRSA